jgi:predicted DNA-binding protein (UPF0251 family)
MSRPRICRRVRCHPKVVYYKPRGIPLSLLEEVDLTLEELEALRLKHCLDLEQIEAAKRMTISQPTFQRTLTSAYKKIAEALLEGKAIKIIK